MGSHQPAVETRSNLVRRLKQNADLSHSPCFPPPPRLLCPPEQTQPDQGPSPGSEPERELAKHQVLHRHQALDSAAWGAALGAGTQYFANQVFNPCRNRGGTRNSNTKGTNNRIFGSNSNIDNGILGFLGGFAAASVAQNAGLTPNCG